MHALHVSEIGFALALSLCASCGDDTTAASSAGGAGGGTGGFSGPTVTGTGAVGGAAVGGQGGIGGGNVGGRGGGGGGGDGTGGALITGCATPGGVNCPDGQMCCTGVPYPEEGACHPECNMVSDRAMKEGFQSIDRERVLEQLVSLELSEWSYKSDGSGVRHVGPMAQDFRQAFGLGTDAEHIHTVDGQGVTIAALQALYGRLEQLQKENEALRGEHSALEKRLEELERSR